MVFGVVFQLIELCKQEVWYSLSQFPFVLVFGFVCLSRASAVEGTGCWSAGIVYVPQKKVDWESRDQVLRALKLGARRYYVHTGLAGS
jgi:hypothetical protein